MSCCIYEDADMPEFCLVVEVGAAHKFHKCSECGKTIQVGDPYRRITGKWDGQLDRFFHCEKCSDLWDAMLDVDCPMYGGLWECYEDYLEYVQPPVMLPYPRPESWTEEDEEDAH